MRLKCERPKESKESYENDAQQKPQPVEKEAEVVADRGEHGVDGVALTATIAGIGDTAIEDGNR